MSNHGEKPITKLSDLRRQVAELQSAISIVEKYNEAIIWFLVYEYGADKSAICSQFVEEKITAYIIGCQKRCDFVRSPSEFLENWIFRMTDYDLSKVGIKPTSLTKGQRTTHDKRRNLRRYGDE